MTRSGLVALSAFLIFVACSESASAPPARICTPGNYVFCRCKDRSEGTKLCNAEGDGFARCEGCLSGSDPNDIGDPEPAPEPGPPPSAKDAGVDAAVIDAGPPPGDSGPPVPRPKVGELFVTEIMYNPSGPEPSEEWFEVFSIALTPVAISGLQVRDGAGRTHLIPYSPVLTLDPGAHKLIVRNKPAAIAAGVPAASILAEYGTGDPDVAGVLLTNSATAVLILLDDVTELVRIPFGSFAFEQADPGGASIQLKVPNVAQSKVAAGWCLSTVEWAGQPAAKTPKDKGSPGAAADCQ